MANDLKIVLDTGLTLYARVFNQTGQIWNTSSLVFESWSDGNVTDYDVSLTELGSGVYFGDFPTAIVEEARYVIVVCEQIGGAPAVTDPIQAKPRREFKWGGYLEAEDHPHAIGDTLQVLNVYEQ